MFHLGLQQNIDLFPVPSSPFHSLIHLGPLHSISSFIPQNSSARSVLNGRLDTMPRECCVVSTLGHIALWFPWAGIKWTLTRHDYINSLWWIWMDGRDAAVVTCSVFRQPLSLFLFISARTGKEGRPTISLSLFLSFEREREKKKINNRRNPKLPFLHFHYLFFLINKSNIFHSITFPKSSVEGNLNCSRLMSHRNDSRGDNTRGRGGTTTISNTSTTLFQPFFGCKCCIIYGHMSNVVVVSFAEHKTEWVYLMSPDLWLSNSTRFVHHILEQQKQKRQRPKVDMVR